VRKVKTYTTQARREFSNNNLLLEMRRFENTSPELKYDTLNYYSRIGNFLVELNFFSSEGTTE